MGELKIAVIGLGYVGLPLCVEFARKYAVVGFDISRRRIAELRQAVDRTLEVEADELRAVMVDSLMEATPVRGSLLSSAGQACVGLVVSSDSQDIADCNIYIITVPTPIDKNRRPDLGPLLSASETVGKVLKQGDLVIYESTVYPGATEEDCVPVLERISGLIFNQDFFCGYSPERINPGDKKHSVTNILKITSGSTPEVADRVDALYASIINAGTHKASSIRIAEAAKVIENAQRDLNIAFVNELAMLFNRMGIPTREVLAAAGTKWNFLPFKPGLVGGHCIGVDPYYLTHKAQEIGYNPEVILAGRRLNDGMGAYVAGQIVKLMIRKGLRVDGARVLVLGITFKENCPDIRNSRVIDVVRELADFACEVDVFDPYADVEEVREEYGMELLRGGGLDSEAGFIEGNDVQQARSLQQGTLLQSVLDFSAYGAVVLAVAHDAFAGLSLPANDHQVIYDIKGLLPYSDGAL